MVSVVWQEQSEILQTVVVSDACLLVASVFKKEKIVVVTHDQLCVNGLLKMGKHSFWFFSVFLCFIFVCFCYFLCFFAFFCSFLCLSWKTMCDPTLADLTHCLVSVTVMAKQMPNPSRLKVHCSCETLNRWCSSGNPRLHRRVICLLFVCGGPCVAKLRSWCRSAMRICAASVGSAFAWHRGARNMLV